MSENDTADYHIHLLQEREGKPFIYGDKQVALRSLKTLCLLQHVMSPTQSAEYIRLSGIFRERLANSLDPNLCSMVNRPPIAGIA